MNHKIRKLIGYIKFYCFGAGITKHMESRYFCKEYRGRVGTYVTRYFSKKRYRK